MFRSTFKTAALDRSATPSCTKDRQIREPAQRAQGGLRTLVRETGHLAGLDASVIEEGVVRENDEVSTTGLPRLTRPL